MNGTALVIMAKKPLVGSTKTRLCPPLEPAEAALVYEALLLDTIQLCAGIDGIHLAIAVTPPDAVGYFEKNTPGGTILMPVDCPDIGRCLQQVIGQLLEDGFDGLDTYRAIREMPGVRTFAILLNGEFAEDMVVTDATLKAMAEAVRAAASMAGIVRSSVNA